MFFVLYSLVKTSAKFLRILEQVKNPQLRLGFLQIYSQILPNFYLGFRQAMKPRRTRLNETIRIITRILSDFTRLYGARISALNVHIICFYQT